MQTFFGTQVVPLFDDDARDTQSPNTWLYRNTALLRRQLNGAFGGHTLGPNQTTVAISPLTYNEITLQRSREASFRSPRCSGISKEACDEVAFVEYFDSQTQKGRQWHGWVRSQPSPISTLGDRPTRESWAIPQNWIAQALQVKNWILTYSPTSRPKPHKLLEFKFCVDNSWKGFFARAFSPERDVETGPIHVFLVK
jgi:hypothetical protein